MMMRLAAGLTIALVVALFAPAVLGDTCGGNCPSDDCPAGRCLCGSSPQRVNIEEWCRKGGWSSDCCKCIVEHESSGNAHAENYNSNGSFDIGLWQINDVNWSSCSGGAAPCEPGANLDCAKKVFAWGGNTWRLWSTCGGCGCCDRP